MSSRGAFLRQLAAGALGGANPGDEELSITPERVRSVLRRGRARLADLMTQAGLRA